MTKNEPTGPRSSVIVHPAELPMRITRQDYLVICCGNTCAADLLNVFEHWANSKGKETWIYRSAEGLRDDLLKQHSDKPIREALELLLEWGYIERRNNPNVGFDRKYQYRLRIENVHAAIWYFYRMDAVDLPDANGKNTEAIKETRKETRKKTSPVNGKKTSPSLREKDSEPLDETNDLSIPPAPAQNKRSKAEMDEFYELICKGSFGKPSKDIGKARTRAGKIRKELLAAIPDLTPDQLRAAYVLYAQQNDEIFEHPEKRLKSIETICDKIQQAEDAKNGNAHAARNTDQWQQNREMYEAYAEAFGDRYASDEDILDLDFQVIYTWWTNR